MRFLHISDLHLGRSLGEYDLIPDQRYMLGQIINIAESKKADAVLIAGDVFDKSVPAEGAVRMLDEFLSRLAAKGISIFMISGNHDSDDRLAYGGWAFESRNIYISAVFNGQMDHHVFKAGDEEVDIYLLPFVKASRVRHYHPDAKIATYEDAVRTVIEKARIDESRCNILLAHQFVTGEDKDPATGGSESIGTLSVGLVEKIGYRCFDPFDYVALGHIHSPQQVGRNEVRYCGSPLKYSLSEVDNEKSIPLISISGKGNVEIEEVALHPMRDLRHLKGKMKDLLDKDNITAPEDFIYATLTDEEIISDAMGIFRGVYPNTVKLDYDNSHTREIEQVDITRIAENRSFDELIGDFYKQMYGCEISEEEMDIMRSVAREAGVLHEAD